MWFPVFVKLHH